MRPMLIPYHQYLDSFSIRLLDQVVNGPYSDEFSEAMDKEIGSINSFKTFKVMDEGEVMPPGYVKIPYHYVWDCKFDGRRKC